MWMFINEICSWKRGLKFIVNCVNFFANNRLEGNMNLNIFASGY